MDSLKKNITYNIGYQILSFIVPLITAPYISRVLGKDGIGLYGYTYSIAHYFVLFCMLGVLNYGNREISMVSNDKGILSSKFWQIYFNQFIFGLISLLIYLTFVYLLVDSNRLIYILQSMYIISGIMDISWFYFGIEKFKATTTISAINKILTTILIFLFVNSYSDVWIYTLIISCGTLMNNILYWILLNRYIDGIKIDVKKSLFHLKPLLILFIPVIAVNIYKYIDKIMLGAMLDVSEVGIFDAAEKLTNIPMGVIAAIGTVMLPRISSMLCSNDVSNIKRYNNISLNLVMFMACGMAFGLAGVADAFIPLFYGHDFLNACIVLIWLCPCMFFVSWANVIRTQYLLPHRKDVLFCASVISGAIVNIIANIILIPKFGAVGAAISTLISEIIVCMVQSWVANKDLELMKSLKSIIPYMLVGVIMYITIIRIEAQSPLVTVLIRILTGAFIYILLSLFFIKKTIKVKEFFEYGKENAE